VRPKQLNQTFTKLTALKLRVFVFFVGTFNIPVVDGDPPGGVKNFGDHFDVLELILSESSERMRSTNVVVQILVLPLAAKKSLSLSLPPVGHVEILININQL
jgi:hypothetical protein